MKIRTIAIATALAAVALTGCGGLLEEEEAPRPTETQTATEAPAEAPAKVAKEGTYGSDPSLDRLYDQCADGDAGACDDLFWDSPLGSEYEEFAQSQMEADIFDDATAEFAYDMVLDNLPNTLRDDPLLCEGYTLAPEMVVNAFLDGFLDQDGELTITDYVPEAQVREDVTAAFEEACR